AAQNITRSLASHQAHRGVALRERLPKVAALFDAGLINEMLVRAIVWRTYLIEDPAAMAAVDTELAQRIGAWGAMSIKKTEQAIDALIERHDPGALRRARESVSRRDVQFGSPGDLPGYTSLWARLFSADAALDEKRVQEMAYSVCDRDPRNAEQRRADALSALIQQTTMTCQCADPDCEATRGTPPNKNTLVYVITDHDTLTAASQNGPGNGDDPDGGGRDPGDGGDGGDTGGEDGGASAPDDKPDGDPEPCAPAAPAFVFGAGILPAVLLDPLLARARLRTVTHPGDAAPEPRYTPSRALADFIRCRDLTCRFPGCDAPATDADIDHTVPYPVGPTHASNCKCLCRFHHLLKTFWTGENGWHDRQLPDGTIIWTSPTGHTYTTHPAGAALFPALSPPTAALWDGDPPHNININTNTDQRGAMMPRRRHTRAQNRAHTITTERRLNDDLVTEHNKPPPF
ncbi:MAG: DUF222 domain-containing protein, partial [Mycobacterium sp.]